jgi:CreA protein
MAAHHKGISTVFTALALTGVMALAGCGRGDNKDAQKIGEVSTAFNLFGDHKIAIESYPDPKIDGVTVFVSEAKTGGLGAKVGLAQDTSDVSIAVRQTGPIHVKEALPAGGEDVFTEKRSALFKTLHVTRFWDEKDKTFVYVAWSDKLADGSPKNSVSAVVAQPWGMDEADLGPLAKKPAPVPQHP